MSLKEEIRNEVNQIHYNSNYGTEYTTSVIIAIIGKRIDDTWAEMGDDGNIGLAVFYRRLKECLG